MSEGTQNSVPAGMLTDLDKVIVLLSIGEEFQVSVRCFAWLPVVTCLLFFVFDLTIMISQSNLDIFVRMVSVLCVTCILGTIVSHWALYKHRVALRQWSYVLCIRYPRYFSDVHSLHPTLGWNTPYNLRRTIHAIEMQQPSEQYLADLRHALLVQVTKTVLYGLFVLYLAVTGLLLLCRATMVGQFALAGMLFQTGVIMIPHATKCVQVTRNLKKDYAMLQRAVHGEN